MPPIELVWQSLSWPGPTPNSPARRAISRRDSFRQGISDFSDGIRKISHWLSSLHGTLVVKTEPVGEPVAVLSLFRPNQIESWRLLFPFLPGACRTSVSGSVGSSSGADRGVDYVESCESRVRQGVPSVSVPRRPTLLPVCRYQRGGPVAQARGFF